VLQDAGCDFSRGIRDMAKGLLVPHNAKAKKRWLGPLARA
jgi:hypothetical protein